MLTSGTAPKKLNDFVPGKKTLVLDVDYTLFEYVCCGVGTQSDTPTLMHCSMFMHHTLAVTELWPATPGSCVDPTCMSSSRQCTSTTTSSSGTLSPLGVMSEGFDTAACTPQVCHKHAMDRCQASWHRGDRAHGLQNLLPVLSLCHDHRTCEVHV